MLRRRSSLDKFADELDQLATGQPRSGLARRFYREGRREGRRGHGPEPACQFLIDAVELTTSRTAERFRQEAGVLRQELSVLEAEHQASPERSLESVQESGSNPAEPKGLTGDNPLEGSLARLEKKRRRAARESAAHDAKARVERAEEVGRRIADLGEQLKVLSERYAQQVDSVHHAGEMLWDRYCAGFDAGLSRRRAPDDEVRRPSPQISFQLPDAFQRPREGNP